MSPRIPWMTSSPARRRKIPAMAVSLPMGLEGDKGQPEAASSLSLL